MDLIERYLQAVKFWLPKKQQDDIIAELSQDLTAQIEEREARLARPLNEVEIESLLRKRGAPVMVANGYLPQRQLIGPLLFPVYLFVLKVVAFCIFIAALVGWAATIIGYALRNVVHANWIPPFTGIAGHLWTSLFTGMGVVTLVFAVLERTQLKTEILEKWNPRNLPPLRPPYTIPRSSTVLEIFFNLCVLAWWAANMASPATFHIGNLHFALTRQWSFFHWAILLLTLATTAMAGLNLLRPWWTAQRAAARLCLDVAGATLFCWAFSASLLASIWWPNATLEKTAAAVTGINLWLARMVPYAIIVCLIIAGAGVWRLIRVMRKPGTPRTHTAMV